MGGCFYMYFSLDLRPSTHTPTPTHAPQTSHRPQNHPTPQQQQAAAVALQLGGNDPQRAVALMDKLARFMPVRFACLTHELVFVCVCCVCVCA